MKTFFAFLIAVLIVGSLGIVATKIKNPFFHPKNPKVQDLSKTQDSGNNTQRTTDGTNGETKERWWDSSPTTKTPPPPEKGKDDQNTIPPTPTPTPTTPPPPPATLPTKTSFLAANFEKETIDPFKTQNDIIKNVTSSENIPGVPIFYEGGGSVDRLAEIVLDPLNPKNHVLEYWIKNATIPTGAPGKFKGRVQASMGNLALTESYETFRMYLSPDLAIYQTLPEQNSWFTIEEMWFGLRWENHPYPFRINLNLGKEKGANMPLHLLAAGIIDGDGEAGEAGEWITIWHSFDKTFDIPIGEWIDIEVGYKQGDKNTGRFIVRAKRNQDTSMKTIIDVHDTTYHPQSPTPVPLNAWQPLKLYTSGDFIDYMRSKGGVTRVYFDDLRIETSWPAGMK